ncbi:MAG: hypothetical protein WCK49_06745 [Myxococcaceae bacterium]
MTTPVSPLIAKSTTQSQFPAVPAAKDAKPATQAAQQDKFIPTTDKTGGIVIPVAPSKVEAQVDVHPELHHIEQVLQDTGSKIKNICHEGLMKMETGAASTAGQIKIDAETMRHAVTTEAKTFKDACTEFGASIENHAKAFWEAHFAKQEAAQAQQAQVQKA